MFALLWVLSHALLIMSGLVPRLGDTYDEGPFAAVGSGFLLPILVFALLFLTAVLLGRFGCWLRVRVGDVISVLAMSLAYVIGLGTLAASVLFAYPLGFSTPARFAFGGFVVVTCGILSAGKQVAA